MQRLFEHQDKDHQSLFILVLACCLFIPQYILAQQLQGPWSGHFDFKQTAAPISDVHRKQNEDMLNENRIKLEQKGIQLIKKGAAPVSLQWPLTSANSLVDPGYHGVSGFVDHDPDYPDQLMDYNCGTRSYDNNSRGSSHHPYFSGIYFMPCKRP